MIIKRYALLSMGAAVIMMTLSGKALADVSPDDVHHNAPKEYVVKKGDTLWTISGKFLKSPRFWPAIWNMNRETIKDPHWIYPGDVIEMRVVDGRVSLSIRRFGNDGKVARESDDMVIWSPAKRYEESDKKAIATIPQDAIGPFLRKELIIASDDLALSPTIVAIEEGRMNLAAGGKAYVDVRGATIANDRVFDVFRNSVPVLDIDGVTVLGHEASYLGSAHVTRQPANGGTGPATIKIDTSVQEIGLGDRLMPVNVGAVSEFIPHEAEKKIDGHVLKLREGQISLSQTRSSVGFEKVYQDEAGPLSIVLLNRGSIHGVEQGHVLRLSRSSKTIIAKNSLGLSNGSWVAPPTVIPEETYGEMMVFKVFDGLSYAIVLKGSTPVNAGDSFHN